MILFMRRESIRRHDIRTGKTIWETPVELGKAGTRQRYGYVMRTSREQDDSLKEYGDMLLGDRGDLFYATYAGRIGAFATEDGREVWRSASEMAGTVEQMVEVPEGLLVRSALETDEGRVHRILLLNGEDGRIEWLSPQRGKRKATDPSVPWRDSWDTCSNFVVHEGKVVVAADGNLRTIDVATGRTRRIARLKLRDETSALRRGKKRMRLELAEGGYLVRSTQGLALFGHDGAKKYRVNHPPPSGFEDLHIADWLLDHREAAREILRDYAATKETRDHVYILTTVGKKGEREPGLVKVRKADGVVVGRAALGKIRRDYQVNRVTSRLIAKIAGRKLSCYEF
jgi:hypothetical protein